MILLGFYRVASVCSILMAIVLWVVGMAYAADANGPLRDFLAFYAALSLVVYLAAAAVPSTSEDYAVFGLVISGIGGTLVTALGVRDGTDVLTALGLMAQTAFFLLVAWRTWNVPKLRVFANSAVAFAILMVIIGGLVSTSPSRYSLQGSLLSWAIYALTWLVSPLFFSQLARQLRNIKPRMHQE